MSSSSTDKKFDSIRLPQSDVDPVRIVLTMIVRNEQSTLRRCFDSCRHLIDAAVICDTGSTDSTVEIIEQFLQEIPAGALVRHEWKNFGHNRTLSAQSATEYVELAGWKKNRTYLLFLDADMVLRVKPGFNKRMLTDKGYLLHQSSGSTIYANTRLGRADCRWVSVGVTHEYWSGEHTDPEIHRRTPPLLAQLDIDDRNDGGFKAHKFTRDAALLEQGLIDEPNNVRYMFYLAQTYRDIASSIPETEQARKDEMNTKSMQMYARRIDAGGWDEELYFSKFQIGVLLERMRRPREAMMQYLEAFNFRTSRCEALTSAACLARNRGENVLSTMLSKQALQTPAPTDMLFVDRDMWRLIPLYNISICGFYTTTDRDAGFAACERLICDRTVAPNRYSENAHQNEFFYMPALSKHFATTPGFAKWNIERPANLGDRVADRMNPMNPCIIRFGDRLIMNVRLVNYRIKEPLQYEFPFEEDGGKVLTRNALVDIVDQPTETELLVPNSAQLVDDLTNNSFANPNARIQGCEDMRIFEFQGRLWCTFTSAEAVDGKIRIMMGRFNEDRTIIEQIVLLSGDFLQNCEKNWLPYWHKTADGDGEIRIIYKSDPLTILRVNPETGVCTKIVEKQCPIRFDFSRGSSPPVHIGSDNWLYITHEVLFRGGYRIYMHRFVLTDADFHMIGRSIPFCFFEKQVEFACGAALKNSNLYISFGVWDRSAHVFRIPLAKVLEMVRPVDVYAC